MKRFFAAFLASLMLLSCVAFSENVDYTSMTDEQLHAIVNAARNELTNRELVAAEKLILFEQNGVIAYLTGEYTVRGTDKVYMDLEVVIINESETPVSVMTKNNTCCINGWDSFCMGIASTSAGKKKKATMMILLSDADISSYEEIEEMEFTFVLTNSDTYKNIATLEPVTVHFSK